MNKAMGNRTDDEQADTELDEVPSTCMWNLAASGSSAADCAP